MPKVRTERRLLGGAVRRIREARGQSIDDLASRAGLNVGHLSRLERGERLASDRTMVKLANALEITVEDISYIATINVVEAVA